MSISSKILVKECAIRELSGNTFDVIGCPTGDLYTPGVSGIPCYYTQMRYETLPGKEPIKDVYRLYINTDKISYVDTSMKVFIDGKTFDVLDYVESFCMSHLECDIKYIGI